MAGAIDTVHGDVERIVHHIIEVANRLWIHHRTQTFSPETKETPAKAILPLRRRV
jgi:hypothetical protein